MKRLFLIASVLCGAALIPLAAQAQRGGMGMGARGGVAAPRGFAARPAGRVGAVGAVRPVGMRTTGVRSRVMIPGQRAFNPRTFAFDQFHQFHHFHNGRFFFNNCFNGFGGFNSFAFGGFGCGSPFFGSSFLGGGFGYPFLGGLEEPPPPQQQQPVAVENQGDDRAARELAFEVQALRDEMQATRSAEEARNQARNNPPARSAEPESPSAVLVFRDGRQLTARNYAISDHTIWVLSPSSARKFPVSDLDVQATEQANAKNGVEFRLPH